MRAVWLSPSPAGLPSTFPAGVPEVSRFSCTKLPGVSGVYDYAGLTADSRLRLRSCCLPLNPQRRRPDCNFSKLDTQPTCTSVYASPGTSRHLTQNSRPSGSLPLSRKTLAFSASCRFIPAHEFPFWTSRSHSVQAKAPSFSPKSRILLPGAVSDHNIPFHPNRATPISEESFSSIRAGDLFRQTASYFDQADFGGPNVVPTNRRLQGIARAATVFAASIVVFRTAFQPLRVNEQRQFHLLAFCFAEI